MMLAMHSRMLLVYGLVSEGSIARASKIALQQKAAHYITWPAERKHITLSGDAPAPGWRLADLADC